MADTDFTQSAIKVPQYEEATRDQLHRKALQLSAILIMTTGDGYQTFDNWNDTIKENYLWGCSDLAKEIVILSKQI